MILRFSSITISEHALAVYRFAIICVAILCMTVSAEASELLGVRFGPDGDKTRVVFDLVGAPQFQVTGDGQGEGRLIVTFEDMEAGPRGINGFKGKGLIATYAYIPDGPRQTRFILTFKRSARIADFFTLEPKGSVKKHRLVVDLVAADKAAFLASLPVDNRKRSAPTQPEIAATKQSTAEPDTGPNEDRLGAFLASDAVIGIEKDTGTRAGETADRQPLLTNRALASVSTAAAPPQGATPLPTFSAPRLKPIARRDDPQTTARLARPDGTTRGPGLQSRPGVQSPRNTKKRGKKSRQKDKITIVVDPGHGGSHPGAIGLGGTYEKTVNLQAAKVLAKLLSDTGRYTVILTRTNDTKVELDQRADIAHANNAKLFLSIHADGNDNRSLRGSSVYTLSDEGKKRSVVEARARDDYQIADASMSEFSPVLGSILFDVTQKEFDRESRIFADLLLARLKGVTPLIKNAKRSEDLKVLLRPDLPAVLLEMAFISNREDEANLIDPKWQKRTMKAVARAIDDYFEQSALNATARTLAPQGAAVTGGYQ
ncbi:MAG: N-acetylmuramoyl-L-alanine amidase [Pseudomonadota bacterium]